MQLKKSPTQPGCFFWLPHPLSSYLEAKAPQLSRMESLAGC